MNFITTKLAVLTSALLASTAVAAVPASSSAGLIGKQYAGLDFTYADHTGSRFNHTPGVSGEYNLPLSAKYDLNFAYDYSRASGDFHTVKNNAASVTLLTFNNTEHGKAYFSGSLGYAWDRVKVPGISNNDNGMIWAVRAGYEMPFGSRTAVNLGVGYRDAFDNRTSRDRTFDVRAEANHWLTSNVAGVISAGYNRIDHAPDAVVYTLGLRWLY